MPFSAAEGEKKKHTQKKKVGKSIGDPVIGRDAPITLHTLLSHRLADVICHQRHHTANLLSSTGTEITVTTSVLYRLYHCIRCSSHTTCTKVTLLPRNCGHLTDYYRGGFGETCEGEKQMYLTCLRVAKISSHIS